MPAFVSRPTDGRHWPRTGAARGIRASAAALLSLLLLGGCIDTAFMAAVAFPPRIAGLPAGQPWTSFPVGSWVAESGIEPVAIAACLDAECEVRAVVAHFRARGAEAEKLGRLVDDPARLARALAAPVRPKAVALLRRPPPPVPTERRAVTAVTSLREGGARGFVLRMARPDGSRGVSGIVLATRSSGSISVLMVISDSEAAALRLAREVVPLNG